MDPKQSTEIPGMIDEASGNGKSKTKSTTKTTKGEMAPQNTEENEIPWYFGGKIPNLREFMGIKRKKN